MLEVAAHLAESPSLPTPAWRAAVAALGARDEVVAQVCAGAAPLSRLRVPAACRVLQRLAVSDPLLAERLADADRRAAIGTVDLELAGAGVDAVQLVEFLGRRLEVVPGDGWPPQVAALAAAVPATSQVRAEAIEVLADGDDLLCDAADVRRRLEVADLWVQRVDSDTFRALFARWDTDRAAGRRAAFTAAAAAAAGGDQRQLPPSPVTADDVLAAVPLVAGCVGAPPFASTALPNSTVLDTLVRWATRRDVPLSGPGSVLDVTGPCSGATHVVASVARRMAASGLRGDLTALVREATVSGTRTAMLTGVEASDFDGTAAESFASVDPTRPVPILVPLSCLRAGAAPGWSPSEIVVAASRSSFAADFWAAFGHVCAEQRLECPSELAEASMRAAGIAPWLTRHPCWAERLVDEGAHLGFDQWTVLWRLADSFTGTPAELVACAEMAAAP